MVLIVINPRLTHPLTGGQVVCATLGVSGMVLVWRAWVNWRVGRGGEPVSEPLRVLLVIAAPIWALLPFFSDRLMGGTDARWYAYMLRDFIDQLHAGVFPVFIGQGEFAWNGGVHPFRSAPAYMHVAGLWDLLTWRSLNTLALQHLTVLTAGLAGALGFYAAAVALLPTRRWMAAGFAMLYAVSPAWLGVLYCADAYMTFMALAVLPAVLYGNARSLVAEDGRGYGWLAVGLALVWMCHPPTAMLSMLATLLLQGGSFLLGRAPMSRWREAAGGAVLFCGLAAYYFVGMGELPKAPGVGLRDGWQLLGLLLALMGLGNGLLLDRSRWWLLAVPVGGGLAGLGCPPWMTWILATSVLVVGTVALRYWRGGRGRTENACVILFVALLLGAGLAQAWTGPENPARNLATLEGVRANQLHAKEFFLPVSADLSTQGNFQPGTGLWLILLLLSVGFVRPGALASKLFFIAACLPFFAIVRVPWISDFLVGYAPDGLVLIVSFTLPIRITPIMSALLAMSGVVWWASAVKTSATRRGLQAVLALCLGWGLWQAFPFVQKGWAITDNRTRSVDHFRPENAVLDRFAYDLLPQSAYFSHGRTDPWIQARVLNQGQRVKIGPDETARHLEEHGARRVRLTARVDERSPLWVHVTPDLVIAPGERLLLRFEFDPKINYSGWLIWTAAHGYREYHLPDSGGELGFGVNEGNSHVVSIGNSTDQIMNYHLTMPRGSGNTLRGDGDVFADVVSSRYDPSRAPLRVDSLIPYRVTAEVSEPGWIETSRVWLPGYRAVLDGREARVTTSRQGLAMVAVTPGRHELELRYVGTGKLWAALTVSVLTWLGWLVWVVRRVWAGAPAG